MKKIVVGSAKMQRKYSLKVQKMKKPSNESFFFPETTKLKEMNLKKAQAPYESNFESDKVKR